MIGFHPSLNWLLPIIARPREKPAWIFLEKGYEETSTAEVAGRARVSKLEPYSTFSDKRDIIAAVISDL